MQETSVEAVIDKRVESPSPSRVQQVASGNGTLTVWTSSRTIDRGSRRSMFEAFIVATNPVQLPFYVIVYRNCRGCSRTLGYPSVSQRFHTWFGSRLGQNTADFSLTTNLSCTINDYRFMQLSNFSGVCAWARARSNCIHFDDSTLKPKQGNLLP